MIDDDKKQFKLILDTMCAGLLVDKFDRVTLLTWFNGLTDYTIQEVTAKIDHYIAEHNTLPTLEALQKHDVTIIPRVVTPLTVENNKAHMAEVKNDLKEAGMTTKGNLNWAHKLLANPKITDFQRRFAETAIRNKSARP